MSRRERIEEGKEEIASPLSLSYFLSVRHSLFRSGQSYILLFIKETRPKFLFIGPGVRSMNRKLSRVKIINKVLKYRIEENRIRKQILTNRILGNGRLIRM